jgi:signal transduction histidine kinase
MASFNQMASHELRSPLGTLFFAAAALDREDIRSDANRFAHIVTTIKNNLGRMTSLLDNLQRVSRLSDDIDTPNAQRIEVTTIAMEVARQLDEMAGARRVRIIVDPGLPVVAGDPARLELALMNLVSNAIKYSDPDKAECFVEIAPAARDAVPEGSCVISVRDNGLGIGAADQPAIFDRFFRAHAHRDAELGVTGSGLGLAIAADCVRALGGAIDCESALGEGSCFFITVPINPPHAAVVNAGPHETEDRE